MMNKKLMTLGLIISMALCQAPARAAQSAAKTGETILSVFDRKLGKNRIAPDQPVRVPVRVKMGTFYSALNQEAQTQMNADRPFIKEERIALTGGAALGIAGFTEGWRLLGPTPHEKLNFGMQFTRFTFASFLGTFMFCVAAGEIYHWLTVNRRRTYD